MTDDQRQHEAEPMPTSVAKELAAGVEAPEPLTLVLDDIVDYAVFLVDLDGRIPSWNHGGERLKGYTEAEAMGLPFPARSRAVHLEPGRP